MRYFRVQYLFRHGINGKWEPRESEVVFDDIDPETTEDDLKRMARRDVDNRFERSEDLALYGKFWEITNVYEQIY